MSAEIAVHEDQPKRRIIDRSKPGKVTGKLKQALDLMVWGDGERAYLPDNEAAVKVGLTVIAIRLALQRPHVLAYYKQQRQVLVDRESPRNIHRLCEIRDAAPNMPAVQSIKLMHELGVEQQQRGSGASAQPGVTIRVVTVVQSAPSQTYPSDMSRHDVKQINGLADLTSNAASAADHVTVDATPAIPETSSQATGGKNR